MRSIKFRELFDGNYSELENLTLDVSAGSKSVRFKITDLLDINNLKESIDIAQFEELANYFAFPGFSLYYVQEGSMIFIVAYRAVGEKHQLYERGFYDDELKI